MATKLIPLKDAELKAAAPDWPHSAWMTGHLIREGELGCVRVGRRVYVTTELLEAFIEAHTVEPAIVKRHRELEKIAESATTTVVENTAA